MKLAVLAAGILALSAPAFADPLDPLVEAYESFALASDPGSAVRLAASRGSGAYGAMPLPGQAPRREKPGQRGHPGLESG